jgi:hypothetical protein
MKSRKELGTRAMAFTGMFGYLPDKDRYLVAREKPAHRFNVIGLGVNGQEHVRITMLEGRADIHGVYDPNPRSVEAARQIYNRFVPGGSLVAYDSLQAACNDPAVDGLIIATPNYTHLEVLREAVKSGKPILLEKPMATTIRDAYEILEIANSYPTLLQVGLQYRFKSRRSASWSTAYPSWTRLTSGTSSQNIPAAPWSRNAAIISTSSTCFPSPARVRSTPPAAWRSTSLILSMTGRSPTFSTTPLST